MTDMSLLCPSIFVNSDVIYWSFSAPLLGISHSVQLKEYQFP